MKNAHLWMQLSMPCLTHLQTPTDLEEHLGGQGAATGKETWENTIFHQWKRVSVNEVAAAFLETEHILANPQYMFCLLLGNNMF